MSLSTLEDGKGSFEIYTGGEKTREPGTLLAGLDVFRYLSTANQNGGKKSLKKKSDLLDQGKMFSVLPGSKLHMAGRQIQRPVCAPMVSVLFSRYSEMRELSPAPE